MAGILPIRCKTQNNQFSFNYLGGVEIHLFLDIPPFPSKKKSQPLPHSKKFSSLILPSHRKSSKSAFHISQITFKWINLDKPVVIFNISECHVMGTFGFFFKDCMFYNSDPKSRPQLEISTSLHMASRQSPYPHTKLQRFPVFDKYVSWAVCTSIRFKSDVRLTTV